MNGAELIQHLVALGPEKLALPLIIRGYEGGSNEVSEIAIVNIAPDYHLGQGYYGKHQIVSEDEYEWLPEEKPEIRLTSAIYLVGHNK